jgi:hypothetical protein
MSDLLDYSKSLNDVADVLELAATNPNAAADILDEWAGQLHLAAEHLRNNNPLSSNEGIGDRVFAKVFGPDGALKSRGSSL